MDASALELPHPEIYSWQSDYWDDYRAEAAMEFTLVYEGKLPAASASDTRNADKHRIRKYFHHQLKQLWAIQRPLCEIAKGEIQRPRQTPDGGTESITGLQALAQRFERCGFKFAPAINNGYGWVCDLDITFLRREDAGGVIKGGDIDNRLKVLFDALRIPNTCDEVAGQRPEPDEIPFFCLLEDDNLITGFKVDTRRLLRPVEQKETDVVLLIKVLVRIANNASSPYVLY